VTSYGKGETVAEVPQNARRKRPVFAITLVAIVALWLLWLIADAAVSTLRVGREVAAVAPTTTTAAGPRLDALADHPLQDGVTPAPVACTLPAFGVDAAALEAYYRALVRCMDLSWHPALRGIGTPARSPSVAVTGDPDSSACGSRDDEDMVVAWYCEPDETIVLPIDRMLADAGGDVSVHLAVVAHEYGHHVQGLSGMFTLADAAVDKADGDPGGAISRRIEMQANCFAAVFLATVAGHGDVSRRLASDAAEAVGFGYPDVAHGSHLNQKVWTDRGFNKGTTAACDTWSAPDREVA